MSTRNTPVTPVTSVPLPILLSGQKIEGKVKIYSAWCVTGVTGVTGVLRVDTGLICNRISVV